MTPTCKSTAREAITEVAPLPLPLHVQGATLRPVGDRRRGYGTAKARETMLRLREMGVNTVSVLMEGRMDDLEDRAVRGPESEDLDALRAMLHDARSLGFATVLVPHLYLDDGAWRGDIVHRDPKARDAWWASYTELMRTAAELARETGVSLLSIGVELKGMSSELDTRTRMRHLRVRIGQIYRGPVTYSANWDEAEQVAFWDVIDVPGVNGYYPLLPDPDRGAEAIGRRLGALAERAGHEVLVLEAGYRAGPMPHVRPWEWPEDVTVREVDAEAQARAWAAVLTHWLGRTGVRGVIAWVVPTDPDDPASEPAHGFNPMNRAAEEVLRRAFTAGARR